MDVGGVHRRLILAPAPMERVRWHAIWLLAQGWTAFATADELGRSPTPSDGGFQPSVWTDHPPPWRSGRPHVLSTVGEAQQEGLKGAVQELPATADIGLAQLERDDSPSADEAHFLADAEQRGKWVLKGKQDLVDSTSPRRGAKAATIRRCRLETWEVEWIELEGNNRGTSATFLEQLRQRHTGHCR